MEYTQFESILKSGAAVHLSGIGGVSMRALAQFLHARGVPVQGSDRSESAAVDELRALGVRVYIGHAEGNTADAALVIRTAAIGDENAEIAAARARGTPILERAEAWGFIMRGYKNAVCVAGTHGKTTVTGMISLAAIEADADPVIMIGGELDAIGGTLRDGAGELIIAEACEYKNSFLSFCPTVAVVLNIDDDHMDFFSDAADITRSFERFIALTPENGTVVVNRDDARAMRCAAGAGRTLITFGMGDDADVYPLNLTGERGVFSFDVMNRGEKYACVRLRSPVVHGVENALAAAAAAIALGISGEAFARGLAEFGGVSLRFEFKKRWRGADIYRDYSHHPTEIAACVETARALNPERLICVFQPHTYTRTQAFMRDFASALEMGDMRIFCPIFEAREAPIEGVSSEVLAGLTRGGIYAPSFEAAAEILAREVREGDLILLMGAGDVGRLCDCLK